MSEQMSAFADELRKWWSFDDRQHHTHSWHSREDFIRDKLPQLLAALSHSPRPDGTGFTPTHQHYKGGLYQVLFEALYEPTCETMVVYRSENGDIWIRDKSVFNELMGDSQPRFAAIRPQTGKAGENG